MIRVTYAMDAMAVSTAGIAAGLLPLPGLALHAAGIGIGTGPFVMGMCFALAGGFVAMAAMPPHDRPTKWWTLITAALVGVLVAILHPKVPVIAELPVQAIMGLSGLGSRKAVQRIKDHDFSWSKKSESGDA